MTKEPQFPEMYLGLIRIIKMNRPQKGSTIWIEPIRSSEDIRRITNLLEERPRDLALFVLGVNTSINARDLLRLRIGQVRGLLPGDRSMEGFEMCPFAE